VQARPPILRRAKQLLGVATRPQALALSDSVAACVSKPSIFSRLDQRGPAVAAVPHPAQRGKDDTAATKKGGGNSNNVSGLNNVMEHAAGSHVAPQKRGPAAEPAGKASSAKGNKLARSEPNGIGAPATKPVAAVGGAIKVASFEELMKKKREAQLSQSQLVCLAS
jgi:hypothetical protein